MMEDWRPTPLLLNEIASLSGKSFDELLEESTPLDEDQMNKIAELTKDVVVSDNEDFWDVKDNLEDCIEEIQATIESLWDGKNPDYLAYDLKMFDEICRLARLAADG